MCRRRPKKDPRRLPPVFDVATDALDRAASVLDMRPAVARAPGGDDDGDNVSRKLTWLVVGVPAREPAREPARDADREPAPKGEDQPDFFCGTATAASCCGLCSDMLMTARRICLVSAEERRGRLGSLPFGRSGLDWPTDPARALPFAWAGGSFSRTTGSPNSRPSGKTGLRGRRRPRDG